MMHVFRTWRMRFGVGVFLFFLFFQALGIFFHVGNGVFRFTSRLVFPAAYTSGSFISYHRVVETAHAFVTLRVAETYADAFPLALSFAVRDAQLRTLLEEQGREVVSRSVLSSQDIDALLHAGISLREQERYLLLPLARMHEAEALSSEMFPSQKARLENVLEKISLGMPFADIARYFSEDVSAQNGGDLGVLLLSQLPDWAQGVRDMRVGDVRSDFVGSDSYWILKVIDAGGVGDDAWVHVRGIALARPSLGARLREHALRYPVYVFVW